VTVLLWSAAVTVGLLATSLVLERLRAHHRRVHRSRTRVDPHDGWFT
jgi:hypothetical protein